MMDGVRRLMLQNQREIIVRDLDVQFILDDLYSKNVINQDEKELILSEVWILFVFLKKNILQTKFIILFFFSCYVFVQGCSTTTCMHIQIHIDFKGD